MDRHTFEKIAFPYNKAKTEIQVNEDERKQKHDAWKPESELEINDHLYIRHRGLKGINKIQSKWKTKYIYHCWKTVCLCIVLNVKKVIPAQWKKINLNRMVLKQVLKCMVVIMLVHWVWWASPILFKRFYICVIICDVILIWGQINKFQWRMW